MSKKSWIRLKISLTKQVWKCNSCGAVVVIELDGDHTDWSPLKDHECIKEKGA